MANNSVGVNISEEGLGFNKDIDSDKYEMNIIRNKNDVEIFIVIYICLIL
jgi:hypothetical protein